MKWFSRNYRNATLMGVLASLLVVPPVIAQNANFGSLSLGNDTSEARADGYTAGFFPLSNIAGRDRSGNICSGYAAETPDHILVLQQDVASLTVRVNSGGHDTTLLIQGPRDSAVRCGQDTSRRNPDASVTGEGWAAGTYRIWVGTHAQGQRYTYTLSASQ